VFSFPIIERELRVEARKPSNYWGRVAWGFAAVCVLGMVVRAAPEKIQNGSYLFAFIHGSMAVMLLLISPLAAADAISRERREGTLGLLFLTPLTARQIIVGKLTVRICRLFYFWLMFVPLLILPMLTGGLQVQEFCLSIAILLCLLLSSVAIGMIASAISVQFAAAVFRSLFFAALANLAISALVINSPSMIYTATQQFDEPRIIRIFILGPAFLFLPGQLLQGLGWIFPSPTLPWALIPGLIALPALLLCFSIWYCARRITRYAETSIETPSQAVIRRRFFTPILWKNRFRESMRRKLQKNPFVWLEYRAPWARAARWGALLAVVAIETLLIKSNESLYGFLESQIFLLWILLLMITLKSTTSFQYEKESGAIELILVTPITEEKLVNGRLLAVLGYYFPVCAGIFGFMLLAGYLGSNLLDHDRVRVMSELSLWLSILSLPAVGLYFALRCKSYLPALLWTAAVAIFAAPILWFSWNNAVWFAAYHMQWAIGYLCQNIMERIWWLPLVAYPGYHFGLIWICRRQAIKLLKLRSFADQKGA
jgi:ABC-type transport system involved in multi-copper enzyme maturation permease subunit